MSNLSTASTLPTTTFPASVTSQLFYLPSGYPVQWSSDIHNTELLEHAKSCWTAYTEWFSSFETYTSSISAHNVSVQTRNVTTSTGYTFTVSSTIYPTDVSIYTECDGSPRVTDAPKTTSFASTSGYTYPHILTVSPSFPLQSCSMNSDDCAIAWFGSNLGHFDDDSWINSRLAGACGEPHDIGQPCVIQGGPARLYYFPVPTTEGCAANATSATTMGPTNTTAVPITTLGNTFMPNSAYISFETLYAAYRSYQSAGGTAIQIGPTFSNTVIAFRSDEISTNCYGRIGTQTTTAGWGIGTQMNYADLNLPVPASAYACANQCLPFITSMRTGSDTLVTVDTTSLTPNPCETIWDNFNPLLAVPTRLRTMVPEWSTCSFYNDWIANVVFDPPLALQEVTAEAAPTLPGSPQTSTADNSGPTTPASPASTASPAGPTQTDITLPNDPATTEAPSPASQIPNTPTNDPATVPALPESTAEDTPSPSLQSQDYSTPASPASQKPQTQQETPQPASQTAGQETNAPVDSPAQSQQNGQSAQAPNTIQFTALEDSPSAVRTQPQGSASQAPESQAPAAVFTVGSSTLTAQEAPGNNIVIGDTTVPIGQALTVSGAVVSAASSGVVVQASNAEPSESPVFVAGSITASPVAGTSNAAVINGVTLAQGQSAISSNGQVISFGSSGLQVVSGDQTQMFSFVNNPSQTGNVLMAGSLTASPVEGSASAAVLNGYTLSAGGSAITMDGQTVTYGSSGLQAISAGQTQDFSAMSQGTAIALPTNAAGSSAIPLMTLDGNVYSGSPIIVNGTRAWKVGSQTLLPGSQVTLSNGDVATISGSSMLVEKPETSSNNLGGIIASGLGMTSSSSSMTGRSSTRTTTPGSNVRPAASSTSTSAGAADVKVRPWHLGVGLACGIAAIVPV